MDPSAMMSMMGGGNREPNAMARMLDCAGIGSQPWEKEGQSTPRPWKRVSNAGLWP